MSEPEGRDEDTPDAGSSAVADAARKIATGEPVDWSALEADADSTADRGVLRGLLEVQAIARFHRDWPDPAVDRLTLPPAAWGHLTIIEEIGRGSFGRVYRARDPRLDREVALKILDRGPTSDSPHARTVVEEGRHLARLRHPNIVSIHRADYANDYLGLEMELVRGRTLSAIVRAQGPFSADEATLISREVCRALAAVHHAGLVHRDVKAQNVIRERGGRIVLMDFGAGRLADVFESAEITGTPLYLAPEVLRGSPPTPRSDLFSLGVLLYYLVTESFPITARTIEELQEGHSTGRTVRLCDARPDLPERFVHLVERALAPDPKDRIDSAGRFEAELSETLGLAAQVASPWFRVRRGALAGI